MPPSIAGDIRTEADRLSGAAVEDGVPLRLMGGLAVWLRSPSVRRPPFAREYADLDFAASSRGRSSVKGFLEAQGYVPEKLFNALHGAQRLNYAEPDGRWTIDVIFDELAMSHRIDLRAAFTGGQQAIPVADRERTLPLADLLLTKMQIWEINRKDVGDALCLLADHAIAESGPDVIDLGRLRSVLVADWGLCHTFERNLGKVAELAVEAPPSGSPYDVERQVAMLHAAIRSAPKSLAWKARARVGERMRWYETPEEVRH